MTVETGTLMKSKLARDPSPVADLEARSNLADANSDFAFDLYQHLRQQQDGNLFFSPYSISAALAMLYAAARGATEAQMTRTLHYAVGQTALHATFNALDRRLNSPERRWDGGVDPAGARLLVASALWAQRGYAFRPEFLDVLGRNYGAGVQLADYRDDAGREQARLAINAWVSSATERKIPQLVGPGGLSALTRMVLANAIYFQGSWSDPFDDDSPRAPFYKLDGSQVAARLMYRHTHTDYARTPECEVVGLPYRGHRLAFILLLPPAEQFAAFEQSLTAQKLKRIVLALRNSDVKLHLPRFIFDTSMSLAAALAALGMPLAFDAAQADFSGASARGDLFLSDVIHKAFVAVDEKGTEAAAATGLLSSSAALRYEPPPPIVVRADHPFIFLIRDGETDSLLFLGRVLDPGESAVAVDRI